MPRLRNFSFIIPTLNEEKNIIFAIQSIQNAFPNQHQEIVIVDNGSSDRTVTFARREGAKVLVKTDATIAGLRNLGATQVTGDTLVFIDADVTLSRDWLKQSLAVLDEIPDRSRFITGSTCSVPEKTSFIQRHWFSKLTHSSSSYVNSGHMIMSHETFKCLHGFDETLKTAEDYDICQRAKALNIEVFRSPEIVAYHHGYPTTLRQFVVREAWHGRQDFHSLRTFVRSRTAILASVSSTMLVTGLATLIFSGLTIASATIISASLLITMTFTVLKFRRLSIQEFFPTAICAQLYLLARAFSPFLRIRRPSARA